MGTILRLASDPRNQFDKFIVVYNHDQLFKQDEPKLQKISELHRCAVEPIVITRDHSLVEVPNLRTVVIIDEADHVLLDRRTKVKMAGRIQKKPHMIGLTATRERDYLTYERIYLS